MRTMPYREKTPALYILASRRNGTLYIGVTSDLAQRAALRKQDLIEGFTKKYRVHRLVYLRRPGGPVAPGPLSESARSGAWVPAWSRSRASLASGAGMTTCSRQIDTQNRK